MYGLYYIMKVKQEKNKKVRANNACLQQVLMFLSVQDLSYL